VPYTTSNGTQYHYQTDNRYAPVYGKSIRRLVQFFPGMGCVPFLKTEGTCCTFCRLPHATRHAVLGEGYDDHFESWIVGAGDLREMFDKSLEESGEIDNITLFNGGSFLTDREIPAEFRQYVYRGIAAHPTARQLMIESRPEFVREKTLAEALDIIGEKNLMVGIGLESSDDFVRNKLLKKFIGKKSFTDSVRLMQNMGVQIFVYTFLKAPGLSERESLDDVLRTIQFLVDLGVDEIALSCAFVPPGGQLEELYKRGEFRPPWLWTILEVIKQAHNKNWPLTVGGFEDFPPPIAVSQNCGSCDSEIFQFLDHYRADGAGLGQSDLSCTCHDEWRLLMAEGTL